MITPEYLNKGDKIGIISTARKISEAEIRDAIQIISGWGFKPVLGKHIFNTFHQFAGTDAERAEDLQSMLDNPEIKAVLISRGGYGTVRIIDQIDFIHFQQQPKWICGFSDVTALHSHIHQNFKIETLHCNMPLNFAPGKASKESLESIKDALTGKQLQYVFNDHPLNIFEEVNGTLCGGNLSMLYSLIGSPSDINTSSKILFIEDLDEYLYHVDRMMQNMKRSGKLAAISGLLVGGMNDMNDNTIPFGKNAYRIILETAESFDFPVIFDFPAGHIHNNLALILGRNAHFGINNKGVELVFDPK